MNLDTKSSTKKNLQTALAMEQENNQTPKARFILGM